MSKEAVSDAETDGNILAPHETFPVKKFDARGSAELKMKDVKLIHREKRIVVLKKERGKQPMTEAWNILIQLRLTNALYLSMGKNTGQICMENGELRKREYGVKTVRIAEFPKEMVDLV